LEFGQPLAESTLLLFLDACSDHAYENAYLLRWRGLEGGWANIPVIPGYWREGNVLSICESEIPGDSLTTSSA